MNATANTTVGESANIRDMLLMGRHMKLRDRMNMFSMFRASLEENNLNLLYREVLSAADRHVLVRDPRTDRARPMIMFGSNNYLGLATHPHVLKTIRNTMDLYGAGLGGPPILNGYTTLHRELEDRLAELKGSEAALLFSSGYGANIGLATALFQRQDVVLYDACSHASFVDGLVMTGARKFPFRHNDMPELERLLREHEDAAGDVFVAVEGVYSMDGDLAPLDSIVLLCRKYGAVLLLDDAHGTGVMGENGSGTAEAFHVHGEIDVTMGTFSKAFGMSGGFVTASRGLVEFLRIFARSYMFSASPPPVVVAAVLAGLNVLEKEPQRRAALHENVRYAAAGLASVGIHVRAESAIIAIHVPATMNIRRAATAYHERGLFVNSIEYPAVPLREQRFRISLMATHTHEDIDRLVEATAKIWATFDGHKELSAAA